MGRFSCAECHMSPWKLSHLLSSSSPVNTAMWDHEHTQLPHVSKALLCMSMIEPGGLCRNIWKFVNMPVYTP